MLSSLTQVSTLRHTIACTYKCAQKLLNKPGFLSVNFKVNGYSFKGSNTANFASLFSRGNFEKKEFSTEANSYHWLYNSLIMHLLLIIYP